MRAVSMRLIFMSDAARATLAAGECPYCCVSIPFPTVAWMHGLSLLYCRFWSLSRFACVCTTRTPESGHCRTPRGPKALLVFAVQMALVAGGGGGGLPLKGHVLWPY